LCSNRQIYRY